MSEEQIRIFHDIQIKYTHETRRFEDIDFWPENARTILPFNALEQKSGRRLEDIELRDITEYLASRPDMKLPELAKSIKHNGVRVPLIILNDGRLLDGNRRFFACSLINIREGKNYRHVLDNIDVHVIKNEDLVEGALEKILAEVNFLDDYRLPWPDQVKASVISNAYEKYISEGVSNDEAYQKIYDLYGVQGAKLREYLETMNLVNNFIDDAEDNLDILKRREIALNKYIYFNEYRNKALNGRSALDDEELTVVEPLFFKMMKLSRFKNFKQVEPMVRAVRIPEAWSLLEESQGMKIDIVDTIYKENKSMRSIEDKVRSFNIWLDKLDPFSISDSALKQLEKLEDILSFKVRKK